jgi:C4-dicarboxylate-specific signal transduction histidine kinase
MTRQEKKDPCPAVIAKWETAFAGLMEEAAVGRLFRGIIHNLNGAMQAFSMQSELFGMMFFQAHRYLDQIMEEGKTAEKEEAIKGLAALLDKRAGLAKQMSDKVILCQHIVQATLNLNPSIPEGESKEIPVAEVVEKEIAFLCADSFFKHKVNKKLQLEKELTLTLQQSAAFRRALGILLQNALEAVMGLDNPEISIVTRRKDDCLVAKVKDNGKGIPEAIYPDLFKPFISGKENHFGLGLYMAKRAITSIGGKITCSPGEQGTTFLLQICVGE